MTPRPVLIRLILPFAGTMVLLVAACGSMVYFASQRNVRMEQVNDLHRLATLIRGQILADSPLSPTQSTQIQNLAHALDARITLIDSTGKVMVDSDADAERMENHNERPEVVAARQSGIGSSVRFSATLQQQAVYVATALDPTKPDGVILRLSYPQSVWAKLTEPLWPIVVASAVAALLLMAWLGLILRRQWIEPVQALAATTDRLAAGHWDARAIPHGADDLKFLSERLNLAAEHAEQQLADSNSQRADLQALVDSLPDPIFLIDPRGMTALVNLAAARIADLPRERALGRKLFDVLNDPQVLALYQSVVGDVGNQPHHAEIRIGRAGPGNVYQAVGIRAAAGGVLLVLRNVTTMATAIQMKTDFVANASHELRTPIAAIKLAFETLRDVYQEDPQQTVRCISIIDGHLKRLEDMLSDLLDLSRVESPDTRPELGKMTAEDIFSAVHATFGSIARDKRVTLQFEGDEKLIFISDKRLLNLIVKNLVENSLKFTSAAGKVTVRFTIADETATLAVIDTGIGIPPQHLDRVFERFYQVDAARSSSAAGRGTGLGLAIVKHAINALDGQIHLESKIGVGTTVECSFPVEMASASSGPVEILRTS
jgi:two-component system phosphate regulon sensor histidine kinase PhoR